MRRRAAGLLAACALAALIGAPPAHAQAGDLVLLETKLTVGQQVLSGVTYTGFADNYSLFGETLNFGSLEQSTFTFGSSVNSIRMLADDGAVTAYIRISRDSGTVPGADGDYEANVLKLLVGTKEITIPEYGRTDEPDALDVNTLLGVTAGATEVTVKLTAPGFVPGAPGAPTLGSIAIDGVLHVSWSVPSESNRGRLPITGYDVQYRKSAGTDDWVIVSLDSASPRLLNLVSLDPGTEYEVQVRAKNEASNEANPAGAWSASATATSGMTPASNAPPLLSDLALSDAATAAAVTLSPPFVATGITYRAEVAHATAAITVDGTAADTGATVAYTPTTDADTATGHQVTLNAGETTTVTVTVTSADAMATQAYTIQVKRRATDVCERTPEVRDAIVAAVSSVSDCADLTTRHLADISKVVVSGQNVTLAAGDFNGLASLLTP